VLSGASDFALVLVFWPASNHRPILFPNVEVDFNQPGIEAVVTSLLAARNPIVFARLSVRIVSLISQSTEGCEAQIPVVHGLTRL
jgi:hypothetical protein